MTNYEACRVTITGQRYRLTPDGNVFLLSGQQLPEASDIARLVRTEALRVRHMPSVKFTYERTA